MTLLGAGYSLVTQTALSSSSFDPGPVTLSIRDLGPADQVRVSGLSTTSVLFSGSKSAMSLSARDCQGSVVLSDLVSSTGAGQAVLFIDQSIVHVNNSVVSGSDMSVFSPAGTDGGPGIRSEFSTLRLAGSVIQSGLGSPELGSMGLIGDGGNALRSLGSVLFVRGGPGSLLQGGDGGISLTGALAVLELNASVVQPGDDNVVQLASEPGSAVATVYSFGQMPSFGVANIYGVVIVDVFTFATPPTVILDSTGQTTLTSPEPNDSSLLGTSLILQSFSATPGGLLSLSSPALLSIN